MAGFLKKVVDTLNKPVGGGKNSNSQREKNLQLKTMELSPQDAIKMFIRLGISLEILLVENWMLCLRLMYILFCLIRDLMF